MEEVKDALNKFAKGVVMQSKRNLSTNGKRASSALHKSIDYELETYKSSFTLSILMEDYGRFVDQGVKGKRSSAKAPRSPYRFGSGTGKKGGLTKGIDKWVRRKGIQFRNKKTGQFMSYKSTSFLITRSIYNKGIAPSLFFTKPFENAFKRLPDELIEQFGLEVDELLEHATKDFK
jgi:hypothetical protein